MSTTNILDLNNRIDALEKFAHNVEPIQQQIDELKAWTDPGTKDASGNPIILTDGAAFKAVDLKVSFKPQQSGSGTPSPTNIRPITGLTECVITLKDEDETTRDTTTIAFSETVYGGSVDFNTGVATVTHAIVDMGGLSWTYESGAARFKTISISDTIKPSESGRSAEGLMCSIYLPSTTLTNNAIFKFTDGAIFVIDSRFTNTTDLVTAITGQYLCYDLATPTELELTPDQLELLKGYNHISTNGDNIELTYQPDNLKADILLTVSQLYGSKISIFDGILTGGDTGQVLTKTSDDNYDATWATLPATRTTTKK